MKKINSLSGWSLVREHHLYNILVFENVETSFVGGVKKKKKTPVLFLKADSAPDGSLDCESALETRSRIMSSEMWWCSLYLPDRCWAPPPLAHMKVYCMTPVSHSFSHSLALLNKHSRTHTQSSLPTPLYLHIHTCIGLICSCTFTLSHHTYSDFQWFLTPRTEQSF